MADQEPEHHRRYRAAWTEYRTNLDPERAKELEQEMDSAQNHFGWDEFQKFKVTLEGYVEYWDFLKRSVGGAVKLPKVNEAADPADWWKDGNGEHKAEDETSP